MYCYGMCFRKYTNVPWSDHAWVKSSAIGAVYDPAKKIGWTPKMALTQHFCIGCKSW